jgi:Na+-driven multidrug efflux pump
MERNAIENDLRVKVDSRQILSIALPISISILIPQLNLLVNNIFLGHLSQQALGDAGVTGVFYLIFAVAYDKSINGLFETVAELCEIAKINCLDAVLSFGESATIAENEYVP